MSEEKEPVKKKPNLFAKGWSDFVAGIQNGANKVQNTLEEQFKKNKEGWDKNTEKASQFFKNAKDNWNNKFNEMKEDIEKKQVETKEQWDARKQKIKDDYDKWENGIKADFKDSVKEWNKISTKAYLRFLLYSIPIIVILIVLANILGPLFP